MWPVFVAVLLLLLMLVGEAVGWVIVMMVMVMDGNDDYGDNIPYIQICQWNGRRSGGVLKRVVSFIFPQITLS